MIVKSVQYKVLKKIKNTSAMFFEELEVGDVIEIEFNLTAKEWGKGNKEHTTIKNLTTGLSRTDSTGLLGRGLDKFEIEEVSQ